MIVTLNFIISLVAYVLAYRVYRLGNSYLMFFCFLIFTGCASLAGGCYHAMMQHESLTLSIIAEVNRHIPNVVQISLAELKIRLWFITVVLIGFAECFFFFLLKPVLQGRLVYLEYYFLFMLGLYMLVNLLVDHYIVVVSFHVLTQTIFILLSFYFCYKHRQLRFLWLTLLAFYNIIAGVMQQLMMRGYVPTGNVLHYNDWYHLFIIVFLLLAYYAMVTQGVAKQLEAVRR